MNQVTKLWLLIFLILGLMSANFVLAQTSPPVSSDALQALIQQLQEQVKLLQKQIVGLQSQLDTAKKETQEVKKEIESVKIELKLTKFLQRGAQGEEVRQLQEFLKQFPDIYPEGLVTGYYGALTENAIKKLQEKHGIETVGNVGPKTLSKINELLAEGAGKSGVIPPGLLFAPGISKPTATSTEIPSPAFVATTTVSTTTVSGVAATTNAVVATTTTNVVVPVAAPAPAGTGVAAAAPTVPAPSPTPSPAGIVFEYVPTIKILSPTSEATYTTSSSTVVLTASITDDKAVATSTVFWRNLAILGTQKNYTFTVTGTTWETSPISLVPGVNNIVINAEDFQQPQPGVGAGGVFVTYNPPPPPPLPVISNLQAGVTENSAVVSWNTDRSTDSLLHYALSITALISSPLVVGPGTTATNHSLSIGSLSSGTKYYYTVISKDSSGLTATSSNIIGILSFTTLVPVTPPIGYWKFDGNGSNEISGGPSAVIVGNAIFNASGGKYGGYAYIPSQSDWVKIPYNSVFDLPTSFTIEFWFRQRSDQSFAQDLVYKGTPVNNYNFRVFRQLWNQYNFGPIIVGYTAVNTGYWSQSSNPNQLSHGSWHHIVFIRNNSAAAYYLDGTLIHSLDLANYTEYAGSVKTPANDIIIGDSAVDTDIDNLKIYNRALNSSEVSQSYNSSTGDLGLKERLASIAAAVSRLSEEIKKLFGR